jgi:hypothetical protein
VGFRDKTGTKACDDVTRRWRKSAQNHFGDAERWTEYMKPLASSRPLKRLTANELSAFSVVRHPACGNSIIDGKMWTEITCRKYGLGRIRH